MTVTAQKLTIEGWVPPPVLNGSRQRHWSTLRAEAQAVKTRVWLAARAAGWVFVPGKVRLTVVFVFPNHRRRDIDNLTARCKHLIDGLKPRGVIYPGYFTDDSIDLLDLSVRAEVRPGVTATELTLEAV